MNQSPSASAATGTFSARVAAELPYLRRYARALRGSQGSGDQLVEAMLGALVADRDAAAAAGDLRAVLFTLLHRADVQAAAPPGREVNRLDRLDSAMRQMLLLTALEGFAPDMAARITGTDPAGAAQLLAEAYRRLDAETRTSVLIIEDEPLIAMDLEQLVLDLGHSVTGLAATRAEAVAAAAANPPGLILADIQLADGSSGIDAVADICRVADRPVIFITAYPERLLTGRAMEPAFLITKPFRHNAVRAAISQVLIFEPSPAVA